jgi:hypothetical protein
MASARVIASWVFPIPEDASIKVKGGFKLESLKYNLLFSSTWLIVGTTKGLIRFN